MTKSVFVGVDGCRYGWFSVGLDADGNLARCGVYDTFEKLLTCNADASLILVDIPIGLPDGEDERECDTQERKNLKGRRSSVFRTPTRQAVQAVVKSKSYKVTSGVQCEVTNKGLSKQTFNITHKIAQVDRALHLRGAGAQPPVREAHPEVCFWALSSSDAKKRTAMRHNKKIREGERERLDVLKCHLTQAPSIYKGLARGFPSSQVADDDIIDALAAAVTGWLGMPDGSKIATLPAEPPCDALGLRMEMVYWEPVPQAASDRG